jgi:hypothetical protein
MALDEGTSVLGSDGETLGKVSKVVADLQKDIFSGIAFRSGAIGVARFAPADLVEEITQNAVRLTISSGDADKLEDYQG